MFGTDRAALRQQFYQAWAKHQQQQLLSPLEAEIVAVILMHPEYHDFFNDAPINPCSASENTDVFLHLSLHLSLWEQLSTNRPRGIQTIYQELLQKYNDELIVEHDMMECLSHTLWLALHNNQPLDEAAYLAALRRL